MTTAHGRSPSDEPDKPTGRPTDAGRRRGRVLVPGVIVGVILFVFAFMLLVTRCGSSQDEVGGSRAGSVGVAVGVAVMGDAPAERA